MSDYEYWSNQNQKVLNYNFDIGLIERVFPQDGIEINNSQQALLNIIQQGLDLTIHCLDDEQYYCPFSDDLSDKFAVLLREFEVKIEEVKDKISNIYNPTMQEYQTLTKKSRNTTLTEEEKQKISELEDKLITYS